MRTQFTCFLVEREIQTQIGDHQMMLVEYRVQGFG